MRLFTSGDFLVTRLHSPTASKIIISRIRYALKNALNTGDEIRSIIPHLPSAYKKRCRTFIKNEKSGLQLSVNLADSKLLPEKYVRIVKAQHKASNGNIKLLDHLLAGIYHSFTDVNNGIRSIIAWAQWIIPISLIIMSWVAVTIIPKYERIFLEIGIKIPWTTQLLIEVSDWLNSALGPAVIFLIVVGSSTIVQTMVYWWHSRVTLREKECSLIFLHSSIQCGIAEDKIAAGIGVIESSEPVEHASFESLTDHVGIHSHSPNEIAAKIISRRRIKNNWKSLLVAIMQVLFPLLMAAPVTLMALGLFAPLLTIISSLNEGT